MAFSPGCLLALAWIWWIGAATRPQRWAHACEHCGNAACRRCDAELAASALCSGCHAAFEVKGPHQQQARIKKEIEAHRHQARLLGTQRIFNVFFAGAGQLLRGSTLAGFILAVAFFAFLADVALATGLWPELVPSYAAPLGLFNVLGALGLLLVYVGAVVDGTRERT